MKRRIANYLNSKEKIEYNNLDKIFDLYLNGNVKKLLSKYEKVSIYPTVNPFGDNIQFNYHFHNICVIIDFFENKYEVAVFPTSIAANNLDKIAINHDYPSDFSLEKLIKEIDGIIKSHPNLKDITSKEKKKKIYSLISCISLYLPFIICLGIGLYCVITESTVKGNVWWVIFLIVIPLTTWFIFDVKSNRLR